MEIKLEEDASTTVRQAFMALKFLIEENARLHKDRREQEKDLIALEAEIERLTG